MCQPFAFFPCNLVTLKSKHLTAMNTKMSDDLCFVEVRIFFKDKLERYALIIFGILGENMLNIQQITQCLFIIFCNFVNKWTIWQDRVPIAIDNLAFHVIFYVLIRFKILLGICNLFFSKRSSSDDLWSLNNKGKLLFEAMV